MPVLALGLAAQPNTLAAQEESCRAVTRAVAPAQNACLGQETLSIAAAGDVLLHSGLQRRAYGHADGFRVLWSAAEPFFHAADIAYVNLEGPVARGMTRGLSERADPGPVFDNVVHTSYPLFNYHERLIGDLLASGIDIVSTANNHSLDRGARGADLTIEALEAADLAYTGTVRAESARRFLHIMPTAMGNLAWLACSYSTNGVPDRAGQVLGCYSDREELLSTVSRTSARPDIAAVIVTPHWGWEYTASPNAQQRALAADLARAGATVIMGTHPHVVQPWAYLDGAGAQQSVVAYSTGNFVSGQSQLPRRTGALFWIELCRAEPSSDLGHDLLSRLAVARTGWAPFYMASTPVGPELQFAGGTVGGAPAVARRHAQSVMAAGELELDLECHDAPALAALPVALQ
ncbi:MAG: CapA family protein [Pseudomonadota bacterium]